MARPPISDANLHQTYQLSLRSRPQKFQYVSLHHSALTDNPSNSLACVSQQSWPIQISVLQGQQPQYRQNKSRRNSSARISARGTSIAVSALPPPFSRQDNPCASDLSAFFEDRSSQVSAHVFASLTQRRACINFSGKAWPVLSQDSVLQTYQLSNRCLPSDVRLSLCHHCSTSVMFNVFVAAMRLAGNMWRRQTYQLSFWTSIRTVSSALSHHRCHLLQSM